MCVFMQICSLAEVINEFKYINFINKFKYINFINKNICDIVKR